MPDDGVKCPDCGVLAERIKQLETRIWDRFGAEKELVKATADGLDRRLTDLNHWHSAFIESEKSYMTISAAEAQNQALELRLSILENWRSWALGALGVVGLLIAIGIAVLGVWHK